MKKVQFRSMNLLTFFFFESNGKSEATLIFFIAIVNIQVEIVNRRLIQLLCKENDNWTVELSRLHDKSTVHRKLTQLKIITQIENFKQNEGESKKERVANPLQSKRKTLSSMRKLPKTLLPSGRPYASCACDGFVDYDRANITADSGSRNNC